MLWEPDEEPPYEGVSKGFLAEASLEIYLKISFGGVYGEEQREGCPGNQEQQVCGHRGMKYHNCTGWLQVIT